MTAFSKRRAAPNTRTLPIVRGAQRAIAIAFQAVAFLILLWACLATAFLVMGGAL